VLQGSINLLFVVGNLLVCGLLALSAGFLVSLHTYYSLLLARHHNFAEHSRHCPTTKRELWLHNVCTRIRKGTYVFPTYRELTLVCSVLLLVAGLGLYYSLTIHWLVGPMYMFPPRSPMWDVLQHAILTKQHVPLATLAHAVHSTACSLPLYHGYRSSMGSGHSAPLINAETIWLLHSYLNTPLVKYNFPQFGRLGHGDLESFEFELRCKIYLLYGGGSPYPIGFAPGRKVAGGADFVLIYPRPGTTLVSVQQSAGTGSWFNQLATYFQLKSAERQSRSSMNQWWDRTLSGVRISAVDQRFHQLVVSAPVTIPTPDYSQLLQRNPDWMKYLISTDGCSIRFLTEPSMPSEKMVYDGMSKNLFDDNPQLYERTRQELLQDIRRSVSGRRFKPHLTLPTLESQALLNKPCYINSNSESTL
jgi:hypothetical protein